MKTKLLALLLATGSGAAPAAAQMVQARDPGSIVSTLTQLDYPAELGTDGAGDPIITSKHGGSTFKILFHDCTNREDCARASALAQFEEHIGYSE